MEPWVGHSHLAHFFGLARVLFQFFFWLFHLVQRRRTVNPPVPVYSFYVEASHYLYSRHLFYYILCIARRCTGDLRRSIVNQQDI